MSGWAKRWGARVLLVWPAVAAVGVIGTVGWAVARAVYAGFWWAWHGFPDVRSTGWGTFCVAGFIVDAVMVVGLGVLPLVFAPELMQAARSPAKPKRPTEF